MNEEEKYETSDCTKNNCLIFQMTFQPRGCCACEWRFSRENVSHSRELSAATATWRIGACNSFVPMCVTSPQHSTIIHKISGSPSFGSTQQLLHETIFTMTHIFARIFCNVPILVNRHRSRWVARLALAVLRLMNEWINIYGICPWNWK